MLCTSHHRRPNAGSLLRHVLFCVLGISLLTLPPCPARAQNRETLLRQAKTSIENGQYADALTTLDAMKQQNPKDIRSYIYSGVALIRAGRLKDADIELNQAAGLKAADPQDAQAQAEALEALGLLHPATEVLLPWTDDPRIDARGLWLLTDMLYRLRRYEDALKALAVYAQRYPRDQRVHFKRGQIQMLAERLEPALTSFEEAVRADPKHAAAYYEMARTLRFGNNLEAAKRIVLMALDLEPDNAEYLHLLGITCGGLNQHQEAVGALERAAKSAGSFTRVFFDLGNAYRNAGDVEKAREALAIYSKRHADEEAQRNRKQVVVQLTNQGIQQIEKGDIGQGRTSLLRALESDPDHWSAHLYLVKIYLSSRREQLAYTHLVRLQELDPQSSEGNFLMAFYYYSRRDYAQALDYAQRGKALRPGHPDLRNLLGNILGSMAREEEALEEYRAATRLAPERPDFQANYDSLAKRIHPERKTGDLAYPTKNLPVPRGW